MRHGKQRGLTLIEAIISVGVLATVVATVSLLASSGRQQSELNSAVSLLASVEHSVRAYYASRETYAGLTTSQAALNGAIPPGMAREVSAGNWMGVSPWGGPLWVGESNWNGVDMVSELSSGFFIQMGGLPRQACTSLVLQTGANYIGVAIGTGQQPGTGITGLTRRISARGAVLDAATVNSWCSSATSNTIRWETN